MYVFRVFIFSADFKSERELEKQANETYNLENSEQVIRKPKKRRKCVIDHDNETSCDTSELSI